MRIYLTLISAAAIFFLIAIFSSSSQRSNFSASSTAAIIGDNLAKEVAELNAEWDKLPTAKWSSLQHPFYKIDQGRIVAWSKTYPVLDVQDCSGDFEWKLVRSSRHDLLLNKRKINGFDFIAIVPLRSGYELVNQYLTTSWNRDVFPFDGIKIMDTQAQAGVLVSLGGRGFFKIQLQKEVFFESRSAVFFMAVAIAILCLLIGVLVWNLHKTRRYTIGFIVLFGALAIVRIAMVRFSFPGVWIYSKYFDSKYFASSSFNASVGDFVLNALIVAIACAYFFLVYAHTEMIQACVRQRKETRLFVGVLFATAAFFSFLFPHLFVESIFHDSAIPFDIASSAKFDGIRVAALLAFILGCLSSFFFVHSFLRIVKSLLGPRDLLICVLVSGLSFIGYFLLSDLNYWPTVVIGSAFFLLLIFSRYYKAAARMGYRAFPYLLVVIMAYALQGAWGVRRFSEEKKLRAMFRSATNLVSNDVLGEYLLNQSSQKISNDLFLLASVESPLLSKHLARQKIRQVYLNEYLDRYAVSIKLYHADGSPADAESPLDFASAIETYQSEEASKTAYEWIYQIRSAGSESLKRYLAIVPLKKGNAVRGYVVLDLSLKRIVPQQVYPELLYDNRFTHSIRDKDFSYAFFAGTKIVDRNGNFNFERDLDQKTIYDARLQTSGLKVHDHWIAAAEGDGGQKVLLVADEYPWINVLANFSFFFVSGVLLVFIALTFYLTRHVFSRRELNYSARIQLFVYLSFILPLLAVSGIAIRMISQSNEAQTEKEIESKGISLGENLSSALDRSSLDSAGWISDIRARTNEIAQTTGFDVNLYDAHGELISSSQQSIFSNRLLATLANRDAWEKIAQENYSVLKARANIGTLEYNSSFFSIRSPRTGKLLGILELPFFNSTTDNLKSSVLSNILITFTAVFILFSLFASNAIGKLTTPLRFIAKKLNTTSLDENQPIDWRSNDEIGRMVKEYNRMLGNLAQSKIDLARSEKENAWREIAKQVAHEIKNPLTPMKLTLQQMERILLQGDLSKEKTESAVKTLLSQVDTLNGIAGSFSAFATMPSPEISAVDLGSVLKQAASLYENHEQGKVRLVESPDTIVVQGDEKLLGRIFSNIILNGLQSDKRKKTHVEISYESADHWCVVGIKDNGAGVPSELIDKIFLPHFSTKETGSGLGLAIAKQGVEQMGGQIWFETSSNGSSFFIKLKKA
ncbi:MAG TPA: ATP-binding protein [Cyclobacteriaceae bacterium]|jgi:signal transduction histidine kinase|nr:ATP-binding protein [Cyclobacteriaceae bacterium]